LSDQRAKAFCFSAPLISTLHNLIDGRREVARFLFRCTQSFDLVAQHACFDKQQLHFPSHYR
jgi:hypothetical protein